MSAAEGNQTHAAASELPLTGKRTPPVCACRSFQVYELPGSVEVHLTADHGQTIAWSLSPRMAAALGAKLKFHGRHAAELHPLSRVPQCSEERGEGGDSRPSSPGGDL